MYTYIAALQPLVDAIDKVQDKKVKDLCASAAKVALQTLNRGASTDFTTLKEAVDAMDADNVASTKRNLVLTREDLIEEFIEITMHEKVDMGYNPTLKELMAVFPLEKNEFLIRNTTTIEQNSFSTRVILYTLSGRHFTAKTMENPYTNRLPLCWPLCKKQRPTVGFLP